MISQLEHPPMERSFGAPPAGGAGYPRHVRARRLRLDREPPAVVEGYFVEWQLDAPPTRREGEHPRAAGGRTA